jgi:hypothetical protein
MLTESDLIHLPYTPDLSEGGIAYACRSLACAYDHPGSSTMDDLRRIVGEVAVELAFRRHLTEQAVPFHVLGVTPFTHPNHYDVSLGGHRCTVKSYPIPRRSLITQIRREPGSLLQAPALIPLDEFAAEGAKPDDLYIFTFQLGIVAAAQEDMAKAVAAGQPVHLIHPLPGAWSRPKNWLPLESLALKSESEGLIPVEIGGMDAKRDFVTAEYDLPPHTRIPVTQEFHSLAYVHAGHLPTARLGLHCPRRGEAYIIHPHAWGNLQVYGMDIILAGWLTHEEYRRKAKVLNAGAHTFQYDATNTKNLLVPLEALNPLGGLLKKVCEWGAEKPRLSVSS